MEWCGCRGVPERMLMDFLGGAGGRSARDKGEKLGEEDVEPPTPEGDDKG